jgi:hypothetical protein
METTHSREKNLRVGIILAGAVLLYIAVLIGYMILR